MNSRYLRFTAWVALIATVLVLLFSMLYIEEHADHDCCGDDCPVCAVMIQCSHNIKTVGTALIVAAVGLFLFVSLKKEDILYKDAFICNSLISQKVRLND